MKFRYYAAAFLIAVAGCGKSEPRGYQYFLTHIDEAKQVAADCADGTVRGDECINAEVAVSKAKARERSRKFFGDGKAYDPNK